MPKSFSSLSESKTKSSNDWNPSIGEDHFQRLSGKTDLTCRLSKCRGKSTDRESRRTKF